MTLVARHIVVHGKVQGVAFRWWTQSNAREMNVVGWVRNLADGSVEALLQGSKENVERLIDRMHGGPAAARVDTVHASEAHPGEHDDFEIRR